MPLTIVPLCLLALALLAGCGEKSEDLSPPETTATTATTPSGGATTISVPREVAQVTARNAASAAVPKDFTVKPGAWAVSCEGGGSDGAWKCRMRSRHCGGVVVVPPYEVKAGASEQEAKGTPPAPDASDIRCSRRSAPAA